MPTIDKPTRVHNNLGTLIDNILITDPEQSLVSGSVLDQKQHLAYKFLYIESIFNLLHKEKNKTAPENILNLFENVLDFHAYSTRSAAARNFTLTVEILVCYLDAVL